MVNNVKIAGDFVIVKGEVMFSNLREARSFPLAPDKKSYDITLKIKGDAVEEITSAFDDLNNQAYDHETKDLKPHKKKTISKAPPKYKDVVDEHDEPTGEIKLTFTRSEALGEPEIVDQDGKVVERSFLGRGSEVYVSVRKGSYSFGTNAGDKYTLDKIKIIKEVKSSGRRPLVGADEVNAFFKAVNEDELAF